MKDLKKELSCPVFVIAALSVLLDSLVFTERKQRE
jgi:hypothetical protein